LVNNRSQLDATQQFAIFTLIGGVGFFVDVVVLYSCLWLGIGLYAGRAVSFLAAATLTWWFNRNFTFARAGCPGAGVEWSRFLAANLTGGTVNFAVYAALIQAGAMFFDYPATAVAAGSLAGLSVNFTASKFFVFR
jgi:putative flippase GtrA